LHAAGKLLEGEFRPEGIHREWCEPGVLQQIRRRSLARLRREVAPAEQQTFARFLARWHGVTVPRRSAEALIDAIQILQGAELLASDLETAILPARVANYEPQDLDALLASGEVVWIGRERIGDRDGRVSLYLTQAMPRLIAPNQERESADLPDRANRILELLRTRGASFFAAIHEAAGGGFPGDTMDALWELVWAGRITNDTFYPVRNFLAAKQKDRSRSAGSYLPPGSPEFLRRLRSRPGHYSAGQGRWSLTLGPSKSGSDQPFNATEWSAAIAQQLLARHGIVMRETASIENIAGGYPSIYPALRTMEDSGWIRRGMFVTGLGAAQFAVPAAVDLLRSLRTQPDRAETVHLAAADPANPYGSVLAWPRDAEESDGEASDDEASQSDGSAIAAETHSPRSHSMSRASGANVILVNGRLAAFFRRRNPAIRVFLPEDEPDRTQTAHELAKKLAEIAIRWSSRRDGLMIGEINDQPARLHFLARFLGDAGFVDTALGFQMRRVIPAIPTSEPTPQDADDDATDDAAAENA
jgi:ATP-dependent Lhr-like helicase